MQDYEEIREIEAYGEDQEDEIDFIDDHPKGERKYSVIPILQVACCALLLVGLLYFKMFEQKTYVQITDWYQQQIEEEIELPQLVEALRDKDENTESSQGDSIKDLNPAEGFSV